MAKRIGLGIVYVFVIYVLGCAITGGVVGGLAGAKNPEAGAAEGARAAHEVVMAYRPLIFLSALVLGAGGAMIGVLPGTARKAPMRGKTTVAASAGGPSRRPGPPPVEF